MDTNAVVQLISSIGFPIVACIFMWKYINSTLKDFTKTMQENTLMIAKLCEKLDDIDGRESK